MCGGRPWPARRSRSAPSLSGSASGRFDPSAVDVGGRSAVAGRYCISCVIRSDRLNHDRRLRGVGGVNPDGAHWRISEDRAIAAIETGQWSFCVETGGRELPIIVAVSKYGSKYLKGTGDPLQPETLLALPECARS